MGQVVRWVLCTVAVAACVVVVLIGAALRALDDTPVWPEDDRPWWS